MARGPVVAYSIGHSNRPLDKFLDLLALHGVECIADVRQKPTSRGWPHFASDSLIIELTSRHMGYCWLPSLGGKLDTGLGRRSPNRAWKSERLRNFADYMLSPDFERGIKAFLAIAQRQKTAIMCAEANWRRCHRRLIADYLLSRGVEVIHIVDMGMPQPHTLSRFAQIKGGKVTYPR
ncbi:MAG: DUF488 domain-containing protein [Planctomycetia bacterium]|nr:DUF488 domain-containing protein [Planctomycetia bacterium]